MKMWNYGMVALTVLTIGALNAAASTSAFATALADAPAVVGDAAPPAAVAREGSDATPSVRPAAPASVDPTATCPAAPAHLERISSALAYRTRTLDEREQSLEDRESSLRDAETRVRERIAQLEALRAAIDAQLDAGDERRNARVKELVTMVEVSRASAIAPMFVELEPALAVEVLDAMNTTKAGKLLAALPGPLAAGLAARMAHPVTVDGAASDGAR